MTKVYILKFHDTNHVRDTPKAFGMAFHPDKSQVTWFAKSKSAFLINHYGEGIHGLAVSKWLGNKILNDSELKAKMFDLWQLEEADIEVEWEGIEGGAKKEKVGGTVWAKPE